FQAEDGIRDRNVTGVQTCALPICCPWRPVGSGRGWAPLLFQQITRCHSVFSCFSPPCPVHCRLVARDNVATREPLLVLRTSGSAPKFPISMTLLRLRLTTDLQTLGGSGPRATTVYDPQVILSIKDTPLVLKFCRPPLCRNGGPQHHCVLDWPTVVMRPSRDVADVSQPGGANRAMAGRGAPPIWPALRQDVRTRAPRWPGPQSCGRCPPVPGGRGAGSPRGARSRAAPERPRSNGRPGRRSA